MIWVITYVLFESRSGKPVGFVEGCYATDEVALRHLEDLHREHPDQHFHLEGHAVSTA